MRDSIRMRNDAITPIFSTIMVLLTVTSLMASILVGSISHIENLYSVTTQKNIEAQFDVLADGLNALIHAAPGGRKVNTINIAEGFLSVEENEDRTVVSYLHNEEYDFTVTNIEDDELKFKLLKPDEFSGNLDDAVIYWFDRGETCFLVGTRILMADG